MTRREGIIKNYLESGGKLTPETETQILNTEYNNYVELCCFCSEAPFKAEIWLNQPIKPAKNTKDGNN